MLAANDDDVDVAQAEALASMAPTPFTLDKPQFRSALGLFTFKAKEEEEPVVAELSSEMGEEQFVSVKDNCGICRLFGRCC